MNAIAKRLTATMGNETPASLALRIKREAPTLADLAPDQLDQVARLVMAQRLATELNTAVNLAGIDYEAEKKLFLSTAGRTNSSHTATAYGYALGRLEAWGAAAGVNLLELTPAAADDFLYRLRSEARAAASIRLDAAACSSFFTWLHRRHTNIENPFRGTKARPGKKAAKKIEIPAAAEIKIIIRELPPYEAAAAAVMAYRGLRAGGLPGLSATGNGKYKTVSKGKEYKTIEIPPKAMKEIRAAALDLKDPFAGILPNTLEKRIARSITKLYRAGKIRAAYSCHDLRHFYAITEYHKDKDIHRVKELLGHASIQITETYLRGLGEVE